MAENWESFAVQHCLDVKYGCLICPTYKVQTFNFELLKELNKKVEKATTDAEVFEVVENFPDLELKGTDNLKDLIILHDYIITILNPFLTHKRKLLIPEETIKIPKNLAYPLFISSNVLGFKYGMNSSSFYNWKPLNDNYLKDDCSFGMKDIELCVYLTTDHYHELLFFGGLIIGAFYIGKIMKIAFEINQIIENHPNDTEAIKQKLELCAVYWEKIAVENIVVAE